MNAAALGQSATWSCSDVFIISTPPCVFTCVRRHLLDISRASILINCARHRNIAVALKIFRVSNNSAPVPQQVCNNCLGAPRCRRADLSA